jgi:SNF2 family DNA or RNA helicase
VQVLHGRVVFASEFDPALVAAFKALPGRKWDFHNKTNSAPVNPTTREFAARWDFPLDEIDAALDARDETERVADAERAANRDSSVASDAEAIPGAARGLAPYAYQWAGVRHVLAHRRVLIGDEMGVGKTITAIVSLVAADTFPAVIVVPEIVRGNWVREFERFAPGVSVEIASGSQPYDTTAEVVVIGYTVLRSNEGAWADRLARRGVRALVVDEAHGIKNRDSAQSRAVDRLARAVRTRERWSA